MATPQPTAAILIIGNEILSGRTQDSNSYWLAGKLAEMGVRLLEIRVVADDRTSIIHAVRELRQRAEYLFVTGGIGPTHDDITTESIAMCYGVPLVLHPEAHYTLKVHYGDDLNEARLKMAYVPEGASLIANPVSAAPGFYQDNVFVMAGVPSVMRAMFEGIRHMLRSGMPLHSITLHAATTEGLIATELSAIQTRYPSVEIGSYPFIRQGTLGVSIVLRALDAEVAACAADEVRVLLAAHGTLLD